MIIQIKNLEHLKLLASNSNGDMVDFHILFANGVARSSKRIHYSPRFNEFSIVHEIDESYQEVSAGELSNETNFITAIENECMFCSIHTN